MPFSSKTLDGIPKEFLLHQKDVSEPPRPESGVCPETEDLLFILAMLLFLSDEPFFTESD
ncbi:MAG: hypothetical protein LBB94_06520 [Clostridiales bacterium]|nr:hypothetical protein [Clostridiales bacterium]